MNKVYIVTVDGVTFGPFPTYERATYFAQDCRSVKPYGIEEVPVDTAIVYRVDKEDKDECFDRVG